MTEKTCENCKHWRAARASEYGECRRYPPQHRVGTDCRTWFAFPDTRKDEWCGEFATDHRPS